MCLYWNICDCLEKFIFMVKAFFNILHGSSSKRYYARLKQSLHVRMCSGVNILSYEDMRCQKKRRKKSSFPELLHELKRCVTPLDTGFYSSLTRVLFSVPNLTL